MDFIKPYLPYIIGGLLFIGILWYIKRKVLTGLGLETDSEQKESEQTQVSQTKVVSKNLKMPIQEYVNLGNKMYTAMKGAGTDEDMIKSVLSQIKNNDDWQQLVKSFGVKDGDNLITWLRNDLPEKSHFGYDLSDIRKALASKGVNSNLP